MKKHILLIFLSMAIISIGITSYAGQEIGYGPDKEHGYRHGCKPESRSGLGNFCFRNLSEDEIKKANEEREAFFKTTEELRQDIYAKELELKSEIAKKDTDTGKAIKIQKEISELKSQFDQKRLDHMLKMKKINPSLARGFGNQRLRHMMNRPCGDRIN